MMPDLPAGNSVRQRLLELVRDASNAECELLMGVLNNLRRPIRESVVNSTLVDRAFADAFSMRLRLFHALHDPGEVLTKKAFEHALEASLRIAGRDASLARSATVPGSDIVVDGEGYSLKTEAAQGILADQITISKLMESAWTKQCATVADFHRELHRIVSHLRQYKRILMLRVFGRLDRHKAVRYDLLEIPVDVLMAIAGVRPEAFSPITRAKGTSAQVYYQGKRAFTLVFDGSDQKITIRGLRASLCTLHGQWTIYAPDSLW